MKRYFYIAGVLVVVWMVLSAIFPLFFGSSWGDLKITPQFSRNCFDIPDFLVLQETSREPRKSY